MSCLEPLFVVSGGFSPLAAMMVVVTAFGRVVEVVLVEVVVVVVVEIVVVWVVVCVGRRCRH